jgi:predicted HD superfamily hydrolase involved in NAD metabolism
LSPIDYIAKLKPIPGEVEPLSERRIRHLLGTAKKAAELAGKWGEEQERAVYAGLYHDLSRDWNDEKSRCYARENALTVDKIELDNGTGLLHGAISAHLARRYYDIQDPEVLSAIRYHTTCWPGVSRLGAILVIADMLEDSRGKNILKNHRELLKKSDLFDILIGLLVGKEEYLRHIGIRPHQRQLETLQELRERRGLDS